MGTTLLTTQANEHRHYKGLLIRTAWGDAHRLRSPHAHHTRQLASHNLAAHCPVLVSKELWGCSHTTDRTTPPHESSVPCGGQATDQHVEYEVSFHLYYLLPAVCVHVHVCASPTHTPTCMKDTLRAAGQMTCSTQASSNTVTAYHHHETRHSPSLPLPSTHACLQHSWGAACSQGGGERALLKHIATVTVKGNVAVCCHGRRFTHRPLLTERAIVAP